MQLHNTQLVRRNSSLLVCLSRCPPRHIRSRKLNGRPVVEEPRTVRRQALLDDLDRLVLQPVGANEGFRSDDGTCSSVRSRTTFGQCEVLGDSFVGEDLLPRHGVAELRVRVVDRVLVVLGRNFRDMLPGGGRVVDVWSEGLGSGSREGRRRENSHSAAPFPKS